MVVGVLLVGCSEKNDPPSSSAKAKPAALPTLLNRTIKPDEAIVTVNGIPLTRLDYDYQVMLRDRFYRMAHQIPLKGRDRKADDHRRVTARLLLSEMVFRELLRQASEKLSKKPSEDQLRASQMAFMRSIRKDKESFAHFCASLAPREREIIEGQVIIDASAELLLEATATNDFKNVSYEEVTNRIALVQRTEKDAEERNAKARQKAAAAKAEILAGASFYSVTTNRAELFSEQGKFWDSIELEELEPDEDLFRFLASAQKGDISDPLDFDDGIGIVGVLDKETETEEDEGQKKTTDRYTLVRCLFNAYVPLDEPETEKEMRKLLLERKRDAARDELLGSLLKEAKIVYPFGKKLFAQPKKQPPKGKKAGQKEKKAKAGATGSQKKEVRPVEKKSPSR